jgi:hypothetical protein
VKLGLPAVLEELERRVQLLKGISDGADDIQYRGIAQTVNEAIFAELVEQITDSSDESRQNGKDQMLSPEIETKLVGLEGRLLPIAAGVGAVERKGDSKQLSKKQLKAAATNLEITPIMEICLQ